MKLVVEAKHPDDADRVAGFAHGMGLEVHEMTPAEANGGWISVEDRLPILETDTFEHYTNIEVICYDGNEVYTSAVGAGRSPKFWIEMDKCATHWQPLPVAPVLFGIDKEVEG